jgi:predicted O-methyltransferase YrrM
MNNNMEHEKHFRRGMGTENVGPILRNLVQMIRPQRILEIGAGYTTPFLLDGLKANEELFDEGNLDPSYTKWHKTNNDPRLVIIDTASLPQLDSKYVEYIQGKFQGKSQELFEKYGEFDMIWFDCGGAEEYQDFLAEYWNICSHLMIFHFTFFQGQPTTNIDIISGFIDGWARLLGANNVQRIDIIEPHKAGQGSITMLRKVPPQSRLHSSDILQPRI